MENTKENKVKFFNLYYGQKVLNNSLLDGRTIDWVKQGYYPEYFLELKPLQSISDEDATNAFNLTKVTAKVFLELYPIGDSIEIDGADYLRSKGYALPFMGVDVETLVSWGWVKLLDINELNK